MGEGNSLLEHVRTARCRTMCNELCGGVGGREGGEVGGGEEGGRGATSYGERDATSWQFPLFVPAQYSEPVEVALRRLQDAAAGLEPLSDTVDERPQHGPGPFVELAVRDIVNVLSQMLAGAVSEGVVDYLLPPGQDQPVFSTTVSGFQHLEKLK